MRQTPKKPAEVFWPKLVLRKWLNIRGNNSEFSADEGGNDSDFEDDGEGGKREEGKRIRGCKWICAGTWNVGGQVPSDDLDIAKWIDMEEPADIYALGIQEIVPLNASNIFGAEDSVPVEKWEHLIRKTLNSNRSAKPKYKCYSDPSSPSSFDDSTDALDSNSDHIEPIRPYDMKQFRRLNQFTLVDFDVNSAMPLIQEKKLMRTLSTAERVGLVWPEQPLDLLSKHTLTNSSSFRAAKSFRKYNSFRPIGNVHKDSLGRVLAPEFDLNLVPSRKKRLAFVRIVSKQMIGIYLSIWVRRDLRKHIQNLKVSPVGVGVMGYIGNKPFTINVELNVSIVFRFYYIVLLIENTIYNLKELCEQTPRDLTRTSKFLWQLTRELKKGRAFDGWSEGVISFPPTYKYEFNSMSYVQDDNKGGRRNPAWCDRILWFGKGVKLLNYKRAELKLSDHRPVTAIFMAEVEIFCFRKLQKALTLTDAEIEDGQTIPDLRWRSRNTSKFLLQYK
ncbi:hypothetical protein ZIOFF_041488 [Zingiber officinale]|uniref:Inositol polyphosphate-related phosphatase domain-containing protein n=1 Tax=Zingiber officinale TaxID=94328 RepID=A0A8J5G560_ZINOF|nr:hypothetical protein ZIOFF_041488 [Zingiber officinale]